MVTLSCASSKNSYKTKSIQNLMSGTYNSSLQASQDSAFYDISLEMHPIWTESHPGRYLYVEQAVSAYKEKPYRQRVYEIQEVDKGFISRVYELPDPDAVIGKYKATDPVWSTITPDMLTIREGCDVIMKQIGTDHYKGSTVDKNCQSTLRGATYATSTVEITLQGITSWDQGYDADDQQVWGAEKGGYIFLRQ